MKIHAFLMIVALSVSSSAIAQTKVTVAPAAVNIVFQELRREFGISENPSRGVFSRLVLKSDGKKFVVLDKHNSTATIKHGKEDMISEFGTFEEISADGLTMLIEVNSFIIQWPKGQAQPLKVKGDLTVLVASKAETKTSGPRKLNKGDKLVFSKNFSCSVGKFDNTGHGEWKLELGWGGEIPELKAIRFYDEAGKQMKPRVDDYHPLMAARGIILKNYFFKKDPGNLKIEVDLWSDIEKITLPLDLKIGEIVER